MSDDQRREDPPAPAEYEAPRAEDVATDDAPSVTAAGKSKTVGAG